MLKNLLVCIIILVAPVEAFCQIQTIPLDQGKVKIVELSYDRDTTGIGSTISKIRIFDNRADTSSLGYYSTNQIEKSFIYKFTHNTGDELSKWFAFYTKADEKNNGIPIIGFLKKLRISPEISENDKNNTASKNEGACGVILKIEFYMEKDSQLFPVARFDSILNFKKLSLKNVGDCVTRALGAAAKKIYSVDAATVINRRKLSYSEVEKYNRKEIPVLQADSLKKGVYKNFEEFRNNNPGIKEYEFEQGKLADMLFVNENGNKYPTRKVWGFCDGENIYINSGDKYSKLLRTGETFYFEGIKTIDRSEEQDLGTASPATIGMGVNRKITSYSLRLRYYQVDMETGAVY